MNQTLCTKKIGKLRAKAQRGVNDIYIWSSIAVIALNRSLGDEAVLNQRKFEVPSTSRDRKVPRDPDKVRQIISDAAARDLYAAVLVYVVAQIEAFLNDVVSVILRYDTRRLKFPFAD